MPQPKKAYKKFIHIYSKNSAIKLFVLHLAVGAKKSTPLRFTTILFNNGKVAAGTYFFGMNKPVFF
jgi:hypothetical protein